MPILKVNQNGEWKDIASSYTHAHTVQDISDLPASLVDDVEALKDKVGANSVAFQIASVIGTNTYQHPATHPAGMITGLAKVATSGSYNDLKDKPRIPSIDGLATESYVQEEIGKIDISSASVQANWNQTDSSKPDYIHNKPTIPSVEGLATEQFVQDKIDAIQGTDLTGYATEQYVQDEIKKIDVSEQLEDYALKSEIPSVEGFATEEYVQNEISKINASGGDGTVSGGSLPEVTTNDNGKVLGVVNGVWDKMSVSIAGSGSSHTGTIEHKEVIEWNTYTTPTVKFDIQGTYTIYKISDAIPTKEQILSAKCAISDYGGTVHDVAFASTDILLEANEFIIFELSSAPKFAYLFAYKTGDMTVEFNGYQIPVNIPETGMYQVWPINYTLPTTMFGSMTYIVSETVDFIQANWEQSDYTQPDFIKNKPFGEGGVKNVSVIPDTNMTFTFDSGVYMYFLTPTTEQLTMWNSDWTNMDVIWDGVRYTCEPQSLQGVKCIGNMDLFTGTGDNGMPFAMMMADASFSGYDMCLIVSINDATEELLSESSRNFVAVDGQTYYTLDTAIDVIPFVEGTTYKVNWGNGYTDNVVTSYTADDGTYLAVGNPSILGLGDNTGEEYFIYTKTASDGTQISSIVSNLFGTSQTYDCGVLYAPDITHNVSVINVQKDIKMIDSKFIDMSWDKITDKPFGSEGKVSLFDDTIQYTNNGTYWNLDHIIPDTSNSELIVGKTYTVTWNGVEYSCVCSVVDGLNAIGNIGLFSGEDNGTPFIIARDATGGLFGESGWLIMSIELMMSESDLTLSGTYTCKIETENIKYLDNKYLDFIEKKKEIILPETTFPFSNNENLMMFQTTVDISLKDNANYTIVWDGAEYVYTLMNFDGSYLLGNVNTFEPFAIVYDPSAKVLEIATSDTNSSSHIIGVSYEGYVVKKSALPSDLNLGSSTDSSLPDVTTSDNNKVLTVVNGEWAAQTPASGLPNVTAADNNKVLKVSNGAWTVSTETQELPKVSSSDAGKFLRVSSSGVWVAETIPNAEGVGF